MARDDSSPERGNAEARPKRRRADPATRDLTDQGGDEETVDGLDASAEALRKAAETVPAETTGADDIPVFERGGMPPKL
jgi:hypothetical protein